MKITLIALSVGVALLTLTGNLGAKNLSLAKYQPVINFLEPDSTLNQWYAQFIDTTSGNKSFEAFLSKLSNSDVLMQRGASAGLGRNQLYQPILNLLESNPNNINDLNEIQKAGVRLQMLKLDIALGAIDATLPDTAHEEFRREVLRGAKPLSEMAKLPATAVEIMTFTLMDRVVTDRVNTMPPQKIPREGGALPVDNSQLQNPYSGF